MIGINFYFMIAANELRIGNWVIIPIGAVIKTRSIDDTGINTGFDDGYLLSVINPIPLTPEILEKCGFKWVDKNDNNRIYYFRDIDEDHSLSWDERKKIIYLDCTDGYYDIYFNNTAKYLHQLQNLYFALTGEELKVESLDDSNVSTKEPA